MKITHAGIASSKNVLSIVLFASLFMLVGGVAVAAEGSRQNYTSFDEFPNQGYSAAHYYFKPYAAFRSHRRHYLIHTDALPGMLFYYNPYARIYYACIRIGDGQSMRFHEIPKQLRRQKPTEMDLSKLKPLSSPPAIPEATDGELIQTPPKVIVEQVQ